MDLKTCLDKLYEELENTHHYDDLLNGTMKPMVKHFRLGMWLRNNCDMWTTGVAEINSDIIILNMAKSKTYPIKVHPDDCSHVVMDIFVDWQLGKLGNYFGSKVDLTSSSEDFWGIC